MKCSKCGNEVREGAKFCNICGENLTNKNTDKNINLNKDDSNNNIENTNINSNIQNKNLKNDRKDLNNTKKTKKKIGKKIIIGLIAIVVVIIGFAAFSSGDYSEDVVSVKEAYFNNYSYDDGYQKIGDAFEYYFGNESWKSFTSDEGIDIVEFNGTFQTYGNDTNACIQFELYEDGSFDIYTIEFNDIPQNKLMISTFIKTIMEESQYMDIND